MLSALRSVQAPANTRTLHPLVQPRQIACLQAEALRQRRHVKQVAQFAQPAALLRQAQQPFQRDQQRVVAALRQVGDVERNETGIAAPGLTEHCANRRCEAGDVRHHHDDLARLQRPTLGRIGQQGQQLVVEDLDLALHRMGDVKHDRSVANIRRHAGLLSQRHQVADAGLHLLQQAAPRRIVEQIDFGQREALLRELRVVESVELAHKITPLAAPGSKQWVRVGVHLLERYVGQITPSAQRVAVTLQLQQLAPSDRVGPVVATRIGDRQQDLAMGRQRGQRLQRLHRHLGHAEQHHPPGKRRDRRSPCPQRRHEATVQLRPNACALALVQWRQQFAPQHGLPTLVAWQSAGSAWRRTWQAVVADGPGGEPVVAVDLVLVVEIGQALGELKATVHLTLAQEARQGFETRSLRQLGQVPHQAPGQWQLVHGRFKRYGVTPEHLAVSPPQKTSWQFHSGGCKNTALAGQCHLEPLGHAVALHQEDLLLKRAQRLARQPVEHCLAQQLGAVAVQDQQTGLDVVTHLAHRWWSVLRPNLACAGCSAVRAAMQNANLSVGADFGARPNLKFGCGGKI